MDDCGAHAGAGATDGDIEDPRNYGRSCRFRRSVWIESTLVGYSKDRQIELTRSRAYKKNDRVWIEQKNGSVVRKIVGYGRLDDMGAAAELAKVHKT